MNEQELNKKLAEWTGFVFEDFNPILVTWRGKEDQPGIAEPMHIGSKYFTHEMMLNFTQSLDACFKWLIPKLQIPVMLSTYLGETEVILPSYFPDEGTPHEDLMSPPLSITNNRPALALCLAIEKLIDKEI